MLSCFWEEDESLCSVLNKDGQGIYLWDGHFPVRIQKKLSRKKLRELSLNFAFALSSLGVKPGEVVAILLPNLTEFCVAYFGILKNGCIAAPINIRFSDSEIQSIIKKFGIKHAVVLEKYYSLVSQIEILENIIVLKISDSLPFPKGLAHSLKTRTQNIRAETRKSNAKVFDFYDFAESGQRFFSSSCRRVRAGDEALILFTSGTTGNPKGVVHTHGSLLENAHACKKLLYELVGNENCEKEIFLAAAPYFHIMGLSTMLHLPLLTGSKIVLTFPFPGEDFGDKILGAIGHCGVSVFVGAPKFYEIMAENRKKKWTGKLFDSSSLKICISGSDKISDALRLKFEKIFELPILEGYGMSEAGITHCQKSGFNFEGSVGVPFPGVEQKLINVDGDRVGEVLVRGKGLMKAYKNASPNEEVFIDSDGWLHTGDLGEVSKNGELFLMDRKKDLIKISGEGIHPAQIEQVLCSHYLVKESAVVGKEAAGKETIVAFVVLKDFLDAKSKDEIKEEIFKVCKNSLSSIKIPKEINFISELPKNIFGKVLKKDLR